MSTETIEPHLLEAYHTLESLRPDCLAKIIIDYRQFKPARFDENGCLFINEEVFSALEGQRPLERALFLFMGPATAGKTSIVAKMKEVFHDDVCQVRTHTTRERKSRDHKSPYHHIDADDPETFPDVIIEMAVQGENIYCTTEQDMNEAIMTGARAVSWVGDPGGANKIIDWMHEHDPNTTCIPVFVLPDCSPKEMEENIIALRTEKEDAWRIPEALWEIFKGAPRVAYVVLMNPRDESGTPKKAAAAMENFMRILLGKQSTTNTQAA